MESIEYFFGPVYWNTRSFLQRTSWLSREQLKQISNEYLLRLLNYAFKNIPYYKQNPCYPDYVLQSNLDSLLKNLPLLNKDHIRQNISILHAKPIWRGVKKNTGGSTGEPFVFFLDRFVTRQKEKAFIFDQWSRVGYKPGDLIFNLRGSLPKKGIFVKRNFIFNTYSASALDISDTSVCYYVDYINKLMPQYLHGYPSTIYLLAHLMSRRDISLDYQLNGIFCGSEKLFPYQRKTIEKVFKCRTFNWYGHSEYQVLAAECEYSNKLHIYPQYGYTELIPTGKKNEQGRDIYEIVATGFNNYFMPLIRYRTQDYAILSDDQTCKCGRHFTLIDEVIGRVQEFLVDRDENLISVTPLIFGQHYKEFEHIEEFQIIQEKPGEMLILVELMYRDIDKEMHNLMHHIQQLLGERMHVNVERVDHIEKTPFGKKKTVVQKLDVSKYI